MNMQHVRDYISDSKFWSGVIGGILFLGAFMVGVFYKESKPRNEWWQL